MGYASLTIIALLVVAIHLIVYVFARFSYEIAEGELRARRHILGGIPFGKWAIRLTEIRAARRSLLFIPPWARMVGNPYSLRGAVLLIDKGGLFARRTVYLTPSDPDEFVARIGALIGAAPAEDTIPERRSATPLGALLPVWLGDLTAALSGIPVFVVLARDGCLAVVPILFRSFGPSAGGQLLAVGTIGLITLMCLWMIADCVRELRRTAKARLMVWLAAMFLFYPSAWFYYFTEWRPRRAMMRRPLPDPGAP